MNKLNQRSKFGLTFGLKFGAAILAFSVVTVSAAQLPVLADSKALSFKKAIEVAQKSDPWLTGNKHKQQAIELMSTAANTLPDPKVSIGLANLPTNGFDFAQEGMTQAKVGIAQMFPRGDTLAIKSQQLKTQSEAFPYQRKDRASKVAVTVGSLWLDAYRVQQTMALIEKNRSLFEQLADVATASYSSALGKTRQQDIVRAQLELTRLEDRLAQLAQQKNGFVGMLTQWLSQFSSENSAGEPVLLASDFSLHQLVLSQELPEIELINRALVAKETWLEPSALIPYFSNHPAVMALEKNIQATKTGIKLAQQKYQPEWGVNASYGYRADDAMGSSRADLFSVGVTFDLPIFTHNRQDKAVQSAVSATEAVKTDKILLLRQLLGAYSSAKGRLLRLKERQMLYKVKLLPQIHDQAAASLSAYTNDDGDFSEVVRSRIAVLNTEIDLLTLNVEEQKIGLELNYLFIGSLNTANSHNKTNNKQIVVNSGQK
ncbi:TolC family protein [Colwellia sp. MB02u-18]|uniref:TolC family protein n=1 Tax=unclassified Colwellia TaxID=196834 RepID=UPI0015F4D570|nr:MULTISPECIES: TolC family protein [unclassified Colwellia]MBA6224888.1 TolC family protein [Colwellia sp. MB3u-45]MBA6268824.1 TolC family protein [Colwellia sp. MB3u-43]MBA6321255.1 TolC family protein [Colwellia sp. MB02u-19]MBA6325808.1 TolC family protein [Colwellia sp. MB02u-18]MBA6332283.1 TolC family protein [Colwellia sp. MB02u-12]